VTDWKALAKEMRAAGVQEIEYAWEYWDGKPETPVRVKRLILSPIPPEPEPAVLDKDTDVDAKMKDLHREQVLREERARQQSHRDMMTYAASEGFPVDS
jgi:hypothetical protein